MTGSIQSQNPIAALRKFARRNPEVERCELCSKELGPEHQHLLEPANRKLLCSCDACAILFSGQQGSRYRRVPRRIQILPDFKMSDAQWDDLHLPISLAFFYFNSPAKRVIAMFPSPAGATESLLTLESWQELVTENPVLAELEPDVEALLVNRVGPLREYSRVPIDECFKLVGLIRTHWRGLSGGTEVWKEIAKFSESLKSRSISTGGRVPDLSFKVDKAEPVAYAAAPLLNFSLQISDASGKSIHAIALRCQIRIEPGRRKYEPVEQDRLSDLFGQPSRWGQTLRPMLWEHTSMVVPPFKGTTTVNLPVPCTFDFNVAATKFFHALDDGEISLCLLFSGTVFYVAEDDSLQIAQIPWENEAAFRLPVQVWREMMEMYYPNSAWLCLRKDAFEQLYQYKRRHSIPTWEAAIEKLLATNHEPAIP